MSKGNGSSAQNTRITEYFQPKRPPPVQVIAKVETLLEKIDKVSSPPTKVHHHHHPFFLAQSKKRKEAGGGGGGGLEGEKAFTSTRKRINHTAPLYPIITHVQNVMALPFNTESDGKLEFLPRNPNNPCPQNFSPCITFDFERTNKIPTAKESTTTFDFDEFQRVLKETMDWVDNVQKFKQLNNDQDLDPQWENLPKAYWDKREMVVRKRSIVYIFGPSGTGKSSLAGEIAKILAVPLREINSAVTVRNGKPFEDILSATHGERDSLQRFLHEKSSPMGLNRKVRMVVLVDEVDLVFDSDGFYTPLNTFLKNIPDSTLVILTSNTNLTIMKKFIDLPAGSLVIEIFKPPPKDTTLNILSDFDMAFECSKENSIYTELYHLVNYKKENVNMCCIKWEVAPFHYESNQLSNLTVQHDNERSQIFGSSSEKLLLELQKDGWMVSCQRKLDWVLEYLPFWKGIENHVIERRQKRLCRTVRKTCPRNYLLGVPAFHIQKLLGKSNRCSINK